MYVCMYQLGNIVNSEQKSENVKYIMNRKIQKQQSLLILIIAETAKQ